MQSVLYEEKKRYKEPGKLVIQFKVGFQQQLPFNLAKLNEAT